MVRFQAAWGADAIPTRLSSLVGFVSVALIPYLSIESVILAPLPDPYYWVVRLAPDAIIAALVVAVIVVDGSIQHVDRKPLLAVIGAILTLVAIECLRGFPIQDAINYVRVAVRFVLLGCLILYYGPRLTGLADRIAAVLPAVGAFEIIVGVGQSIGGFITGGLQNAFFVQGTFDRYDRYGLFMMAVALLLLTKPLIHRRAVSRMLLIASIAAIFLSTSRQALAGLGAGILLLIVITRAPQRRLVLLPLLSVIALLVLSTPQQFPDSNVDRLAPHRTEVTTALSGTVSSNPAFMKQPILPTLRVANHIPTDIKGPLTLSADCNQNFRIWLNGLMLPWAAIQEPLAGFGPGANTALLPDLRIYEFVTDCGMSWSYARQFMGDSNYASWVIQFGLVFPGMLIGLLLGLMRTATRLVRHRSRQFPLFAVTYAGGVACACFFGPAFEMRPTSALLWIALAASITTTSGSLTFAKKPAQAVVAQKSRSSRTIAPVPLQLR